MPNYLKIYHYKDLHLIVGFETNAREEYQLKPKSLMDLADLFFFYGAESSTECGEIKKIIGLFVFMIHYNLAWRELIQKYYNLLHLFEMSHFGESKQTKSSIRLKTNTPQT